MDPKRPPEAGDPVLRAAGAIGLATLASRVLGLVREQVFAVLFGASNMTDAFNLAFRVPNLLRNLFAEGAVSASIVPVLTRARQERGDRGAWRLAGLLFRTLGVAVAILALLGWIFAPGLVGLYANAFREIPGKFEAAVRMTRWMFPFFPSVALAAAFMGVLNACGVFFIPAFSPAVFNLVSVAVGVAATTLLTERGAEWGMVPIEGMAIGVLAGGLAQALWQLPALYRAGYRWPRQEPQDPSWRRDPALKQLLWLVVPGTIGLAATQLSLLVNTVLATRLGPGSVSHLSYAFRLMQFPLGLLGASLAQAAQPRLAALWLQRDLGRLDAELGSLLRRTLALNLAASAGLAFLSYPIVEMIFQYGRFYAEDTASTAAVLSMYAVGLAGYSVVKLLVPTCYAMGNARLPVVSSLLSVALVIALNLFLMGPLGAGGLALGTSIGTTFNAVFLLFAVRKLQRSAGGELSLGAAFSACGRYLGVSLVMGVLCYASHRALAGIAPDASWVGIFGTAGWVLARVFKVGFVVLEGVVFIAVLALHPRTGKWLGLSEIQSVADIFANKLKNLLRRART